MDKLAQRLKERINGLFGLVRGGQGNPKEQVVVTGEINESKIASIESSGITVQSRSVPSVSTPGGPPGPQHS